MSEEREEDHKSEATAEPVSERPDYEVAKELLAKRLHELGIHVDSELDKEEPLKGGFIRHHWKCVVLIGCTFTEREHRDVLKRAYPYVANGGKKLLEVEYFCGAHHKANAPAWKKRFKKPPTVDVVSCLLNDASAIDHADFESWAGDYGYDKDSRTGEKIYRTCLSIGLKLRSALGDAVLSELRELAARL